jgi:hypothetical protein
MMPSEAVPLEGLSDEELFNDANSDEAPAEAVVEAAEAPAEQEEQPRDEAGRFAAQAADEPAEPVAAEAPLKSRLTTTQQWFHRGGFGRSTRKSVCWPTGWPPWKPIG